MRDHNHKVGMILGYCSELPDMTEADLAEARALVDPVDVLTAPPPLVVRVAPPPPAEFDQEKAWEAMDAAIALIARHYSFDEHAVWCAVWDMADDIEEKTGLPALGRTLERPLGWAALGIMAAMKITGLPAASLPEPLWLDVQ